MISIGINNGAMAMGTPWGRKNEKNFMPCLKMAISVTAMKMKAASVKVTARWLVKVKL